MEVDLYVGADELVVRSSIRFRWLLTQHPLLESCRHHEHPQGSEALTEMLSIDG